jgi:Ca2+-binding RTX toxin-like protein
MASKRLVPLLALGLALAAAPAAHAAVHATVSYNSSTGFDIEDLDNQKNDIAMSFEQQQSATSAQVVFEELADDSSGHNFPLQGSGGCTQFTVNGTPEASRVICTVPSSGSKKFFVNLRGGDDHINWSLGSFEVPPSYFKDSVLQISGGAGDDFIHIAQDPTATVTGSLWTGSDGNDDLRYVGGAPQTMEGNGGDDTVTADSGDDTVEGNDGNDVLKGRQGQDTLRGGNGDDRLISDGGSFAQNVTDVMDGGADTDTLDLSLENNALGAPLGGHAVISLDGLPNDKWIVTGPADAGGVGTTHNFQLSAIENVIGTPAVGLSPPRDGNDTITGNSAANTIDGQSGNDRIDATPATAQAALTSALSISLGPLPPPPVILPSFVIPPPRDTLIGSSGDDVINGSDNGDTIDGGIGTDTLNGLGGADSITSKDVTQSGNVFTDTVNCGDGTDAVTADLQDQGHLSNCENADISPGREGRHVRFNRRLKVRRHGRITVHLNCPRKASIACTGSLKLELGRKTAGRSGHYRVKRGHKKTVVLRLAQPFRKRVPFAGFLVASEKGRFGHKTTHLRVIVR